MAKGRIAQDRLIRYTGIRHRLSVPWSTVSIRSALLSRQYATTSRSLIEIRKSNYNPRRVLRKVRLELRSPASIKARQNLDNNLDRPVIKAAARKFQERKAAAWARIQAAASAEAEEILEEVVFRLDTQPQAPAADA